MTNRRLLNMISFFVIFIVFAIGIHQYFRRPQLPTPVISMLSQLDEEIALGKMLFSDKRLSRDLTISCTSCHLPQLAFTDGKRRSIGIGGKQALRNAPSLYNVSEAPYFMLDGGVPTLEMQAIVPIQDLNEMGFTMRELIERLNSIPAYSKAAKRIYNRKIDAWVITRSLARFEETLISKKSKFDGYMSDSIKNKLTDSEMKGYKLFLDLNCIECHSFPNFTNYSFRNNNLTNLSEEDPGRYRISNNEKDKGKFKVPSLRNAELTYPYMHNGSYSALRDVVEAYVSSTSPVINTKISVTPDDIDDLLHFLHTLTDTTSTDLHGF